ncbi:MAG TPA: hypothetical protein VIM31_03915 [Candidatus Microsaccharimonas sp.]
MLKPVQRVTMMAIIGIVGLIFMSPSAHAADPVQLINITPSAASLKVDPGATVKASVDVLNKGTIPFTVSLSSAPYYVEGLNYDPHFTQLPGTIDASQWVHFISSAAPQNLTPKTLLPVDYEVQVPAGTPAGGYYAVIFAKTGAAVSGTGVGLHGRVGEILYITVNGAVKNEGTARENSVPTAITHTPVVLNVIVGNKGGVHFSTKVDVTIKTLFGKTAFSYTTDRYILPQTEREMSTTWSPTVPFGIYRVERTATLPSGVSNLASQWVLVIQPWVIIALIAIIIVIVGVTIVNIRRVGRQHRS